MRRQASEQEIQFIAGAERMMPLVKLFISLQLSWTVMSCGSLGTGKLALKRASPTLAFWAAYLMLFPSAMTCPDWSSDVDENVRRILFASCST